MDRVLEALDGMIESTEEFIRDDGPETVKVLDLFALQRVRDLYEFAFKEEDAE